MSTEAEAKMKEIKSSLKEAKKGVASLLAHLSGLGEWDNVKRVTAWGQSVDGLLESVQRARDGVPPQSMGEPVAGHPDAVPLPYFYRDYNRLVGRKRGRRQPYYEHRTSKEHYDIIVGKLEERAKLERVFSIQELQDPREMPIHEPWLIVAFFRYSGLVTKHRRSEYGFLRDEDFRIEAEKLWDALPTSVPGTALC